jgi:hypothetical protein
LNPSMMSTSGDFSQPKQLQPQHQIRRVENPTDTYTCQSPKIISLFS